MSRAITPDARRAIVAPFAEEYPFASRVLDLDGIAYHYVDEGPRDGEPLLFVHGNPTWSFHWRHAINAFKDRYRCIAVDHVGCGLSDKPARYPYRLAQHASNLERLVLELDLSRITLVVHDWGGPIGLGFASRHRERIARLVVLNTSAFTGLRAPWRIRACRAPGLGALAVRGLNAFAVAATVMALERHERMTPAVRRGYLAPYDNFAHRIATLRFVQDIPLSPRHPSYAELARIEACLPDFAGLPKCLIWGGLDWCFTPEHFERFRAVWPDAEAHLDERAGHYVLEDARERALRWIERFLARHPRDPTGSPTGGPPGDAVRAAASTMAGVLGSANVARFLALRASERPEAPAVVAPRDAGFSTWTWRELDQQSSRVAHGLHAHGLRPDERACVFVRPGLEWLALVHGLFKLGAVPVLIDPGMGRAGVLASIARVAPRALIGVWQLHLARRLSPEAFRSIELALTAGGPRLGALADGSLEALLSGPDAEYDAVSRDPRDVAAILFTSGSTGPAKGVVYEHGMFDAQVAMLRELYEFAPGQRDLACFPLFALFGPALGLASVFPRMDFTAPARCDPAEIVRAVVNFGATSSFGSPAIWRRVVPWCEAQGLRLETLATLMIAGAPVEADLVRRARAVIAPGGRVFTPYGATESLPIAQEDGALLATALAERAAAGEGTCVGRAVPGVEIRLIRITDEPLARWSDALAVAQGEPGEICARGPNVTREYAFDPAATAAAKIADGEGFWHRLGDLGRFDADGRLWFLGRKAHRLETAAGTLFPVPIENAFRAAAGLARCALVGVGPRGRELPVLIVECPAGVPRTRRARDLREREILAAASGLAVCAPVARVLFQREFPVDLRHQAKIDRTALKVWAEGELGVKCLVTGGTGFLGREIVERLLARGDEVVSISRRADASLERLGARSLALELNEREPLRDALAGVEVVFHTAAKAGIFGSRAEYRRTNVDGTQNLLEQCAQAGVRRFVHTSSPSVTFDGKDQRRASNDLPYAARFLAHYPESKAEAERLVLAANGARGMATVALRPHLIVGARDPHLVPRLVERARAGRLRIVGDGRNEVTLCAVENAAHAHLLAADALAPQAPHAGRAYFVGQEEPVLLWPWIQGLLARLGIDADLPRIGEHTAAALGAACEAAWTVLSLRGEPPMTRFLAAQLARSHSYDMAPARRDFGYRELVSLEQATDSIVASRPAERARRDPGRPGGS